SESIVSVMQRLERRLDKLWKDVRGKRKKDKKDEGRKPPPELMRIDQPKNIDRLKEAQSIVDQAAKRGRTIIAEEEDIDEIIPVSPRRASSSRHVDKISQDIDSIGESGYLSTLELHSPYDFSDASTHVSPRERDYRFSPRGRSSHLKSMDELRNIKTPLPYMSRADTLAVLDSPSMNEHDFLLRNVIQTKIITCVFEITNSGIERLLDDISHEFSRWFKGNPPLMAVSTEVQWSVPVKHRSRLAESRLKDLVLVRLRENNRRLLHMRGGGRDLPLSLAHATTNEKIMKDTDIDAYQGVYRRCYRNLLPYVHSETPEWHSEYWKVDQGTEEQTLPQPDQFLFGKKKESLVNKSLVALNMAGLEIRGCVSF
ncbi:hypothetical protein PRIPAC_82988, partial [Pristionchus pacificus]|uniref:Uncharacterized protein n=1 Tax=Pristionchus pacificus TaxID=54126 RepID=A0A8R1V5T5_PRIPA